MAWTCEVKIDFDKAAERIATVTATWDAGLPTEFEFGPRRVSLLTPQERQAFVNEAKEALTLHQNHTATEGNVEANLTNALNA